MTPPKLVDGERKSVVALLVAVALSQGAAAAASAEAVSRVIEGKSDTFSAYTLIIGSLALVSGLALLGERFVGERLAQSYVLDARKKLFEAVIASGPSGREARWLTPMVSDLAALRNWAARGPVRLVTASLSGSAAIIWFVIAWPGNAIALIPITFGLAIIFACVRKLTAIISDQRTARGSLTRFLIRRIRTEIAGEASPGGHGRKTLAERSVLLGNKAKQRALIAGAMEGVAVAAGALSALGLILVARHSPEMDRGGLFAGLTLIAFITTRLSEVARALHAHAGGQIAIKRIARLLETPNDERTSPQ